MVGDRLTKEVREALEKCPVRWDEYDRCYDVRKDSHTVWIEYHAWRIPTIIETQDHETVLGRIERFWREECERRGVEFAYRNGMWTWGSPYSMERSTGESPVWLDCLADAILSTAPKETDNDN